MTLQHVQIRKDLYLVQHTHSKAVKTQTVKPPTNHVWLWDRSGSMHWNLPGLIKDLKGLVRTIKSNDTITLGWFSGQGENNFLVKGFKVTSDADFTVLDKILDKNSQSVGMTCFSEILLSTKQVIEDLKPFGNTFSLLFFTDGYPTVGGNKEIETTLQAVADIQGEVSSALLVGYGNYYNRTLMTDMAEKLGAALTHSEGLTEFRTAIDLFLQDTNEANKKLKIQLDLPYAGNQTKYPAAFSLSGSTINILAQDVDHSVYMTESDNVNDYLYVLSSVKPANSQEVKLTDADVRVVSGRPTNSLVQGVYAAAFVLCQQAKTDQAMEVLATIGDAHLIDKLTNAYTPSEYGSAEKDILFAAQSQAGRYVKGFKENYLPPVDAFCLLDVLDILLDDENSAFYPYHEAFHYKRVGVKAEVVEGAPEFRPEANVRVPISSLVWNSSMLNLSVYAKIPGTVKLTADASKQGFSQDYPSWINRNYTIVKDGFLNVKVLPVSLSETAFKKLQEHGVIAGNEGYWPNEISLLQLDRVPVINRGMAEGKTSATALAGKVRREQTLKAQLKALKWYKDQEIGEDTEKVGVFASLNDSQIEYLEKHYIGKNGFSPKTELGDSIDHYLAKEFTIKVKGLSSFPKVSDVQTKISAGKKLTVSDAFVKEGIDIFEKSGMQKQSKEVKVAWLNGKIAEIQTEQRRTSREIQETKFAILLAKKWFSEFSSRDENTISVDNLDFTFALREVKVDF